MSTTVPEPADETLPPLPDHSERFPTRALLIPLGVVVLTLATWLLARSPRVASAILGAMRPPPDGPVTPARVETVTGTAHIRPARSAIRLPLKAGVSVYPGDSFRVADGGGLQLSLGPSVSARLFPGTDASVVTIGSALEPTTWLTLERGAIVVEIRPDSSAGPAVVATRHGVASLNGTMGVFIPGEVTGLVVACFHGACRLNLDTRLVLVPAGKTLIYAPLDDEVSFLDLAAWPDEESWALAFLRPTPTPTFSPTHTVTSSPTRTATASAQAPIRAVPRPLPSLTPVPPTDTAPPPTDNPPPSIPTTVPPTLEPTPSPTRDRGDDRGGGGDNDEDRNRDRGGGNRGGGKGGGDGGDKGEGDNDRDRGDGGRGGDRGEGRPDEGNDD